MKITNTQKGPRGVNTVAGPVLIEPDQTVDVDVFEREREHIEAAGWFKVEGDYTANGAAPKPAAPLQQASSEQAKDGVYIPSAEFNAMREASERQRKELSDATDQLDDLRQQLADREGKLAERDNEIVKLKAAAENDEPDREDLKKQAKELGIEHAPNISTAKLKDLIDAKLAS